MIKLILKISSLFVLLILLSLQSSVSLEQKNQLEPSQTQHVIQSLKNLSLYFVENKGQVNEYVKYQLKIPNANVYFTPEEIVYQFLHRKDEKYIQKDRLMREEKQSEENIKVENIRLTFVGANESVEVEGLEESEAKVSYFRGNNPLKWVKGARTYNKILYRGLYPHIDLIVYGSGGSVKYEYRVREGGNVEEICVKYEGIERLRINENGQLEVETGEGVFKENVPYSYQIINNKRVEVNTKYFVEKGNIVKFKVDEYMRDRELVIDPLLIYSTYLGGINYDDSWGIAVDGSGNAYVAGETRSSDFPTTPGAFDTNYDSDHDVFITKLSISQKDD